MVEEFVKTVSSKEEAAKMRVELARAPVDPKHKEWSKFGKVEGNEVVLYAQPFVVKRLSPEEIAKRDAKKEARREEREKTKAKNAEKRAKEKAEIEARKKERAEKQLKKAQEAQKKAEEALKSLN